MIFNSDILSPVDIGRNLFDFNEKTTKNFSKNTCTIKIDN